AVDCAGSARGTARAATRAPRKRERVVDIGTGLFVDGFGMLVRQYGTLPKRVTPSSGAIRRAGP
ncbi:MAG: hypothetical protein R3324_08565, partial [Halobacteriales archaeon]|nr:hypothetical protein [Halobacteriales archaeon]